LCGKQTDSQTDRETYADVLAEASLHLVDVGNYGNVLALACCGEDLYKY